MGEAFEVIGGRQKPTITNDVRVSEKILLSIAEANAISGIGINKLRDMTLDPRCPFVVYIGKCRMIKRKKFEEFIEAKLEI